MQGHPSDEEHGAYAFNRRSKWKRVAGREAELSGHRPVARGTHHKRPMGGGSWMRGREARERERGRGPYKQRAGITVNSAGCSFLSGGTCLHFFSLEAPSGRRAVREVYTLFNA